MQDRSPHAQWVAVSRLSQIIPGTTERNGGTRAIPHYGGATDNAPQVRLIVNTTVLPLLTIWPSALLDMSVAVYGKAAGSDNPLVGARKPQVLH
jgi:hypothetical protein